MNDQSGHHVSLEKVATAESYLLRKPIPSREVLMRIRRNPPLIGGLMKYYLWDIKLAIAIKVVPRKVTFVLEKRMKVTFLL